MRLISGLSLAAVLLTAMASGREPAKPPAKPNAPLFRVEHTGRDERVITDMKVNGQIAHLAVDTGTGVPFLLLDSAAKRLKLEIAKPAVKVDDPGRIGVQITRPYDIECLGGTLSDVAFGVFTPPASLPQHAGFDGALGWPAIRANVLAFQLHNRADPIVPLPEMPSLPNAIECVLVDGDVLELTFASTEAKSPHLLIDTGNDSGVMLPPAQWKAWRAAHPGTPTSLQTGYFPAEGFAPEEVCWADEIQIGPLVLRGVTVSQAGVTYTSHAQPGYDVVALGFEAMKRMVLVLDGHAKRALVLPRSAPPGPVEHNRTGVAFVPAAAEPLTLLAHVLPHAPAAEAGVQDGDVLVSVNGQPARAWWNDPEARFVPAGVRVKLVLKRGNQTVRRTLVTRDLLGPTSQPARKS